MKLIREYYELCDGGICQDLLTEAEKKFVSEGGCMLSGLMQEAGVKNGNGRMYSEEILIREVNNYKRLVDSNRALGELDHPDSPIVNLNNAAHLVTKIWMEGPKCFGKIKVLPTPAGKILQSLVEAGVTLGISSRGLGSLEQKNGINMVQDDFQLICFDFVSEPSTPGAFMMKEAKDYTNEVFTKADRINRLLNEVLESE